MSQEQIMYDIGLMLASGGYKNRNDLIKYMEYMKNKNKQRVEKLKPKTLLNVPNYIIKDKK